jgi:iron complex outermembrane recepter protein
MTRYKLIGAAVAAAIACGHVSVVSAAEVAEEELQEVQITGSRIVRRDLEASTPVVTVERETIQNSAYTSIEQVLNELPQFVSGGTNGSGLSGEFATADVQPSATNSPGAATVNLRGLGANRQLTLIDGKRGQPSNASLTIDLNTIPSSAIASVEVITGGASSVYGADALAGVTNFKLRDNYEGMEVSVRGGINQHGGDGKDWQISTLMGTSLNGKGNAMVAMEWYKRQNSLRRNRDWFLDANTDPSVVSNLALARLNFPSVEFASSTATAGPSSTQSGIVTGNSPSQAALNLAFSGLPAAAVRTTSTIFFNRDNTPFLGATNALTPLGYPAGYGFNSAPIDGTQFKQTNTYDGTTGAVNGSTFAELDEDWWLSSPLERFSMFGRAKYDIGEHVRAFSTVNFVANTVEQRLQPTGAVGNFAAAIPAGTQIYLPSVVRTATPTTPVGSTKPEYRAGGALGLSCPTSGGCTMSQAFPTPAALTALLNSRAAPTIAVPCVTRTGNGTVNVQNPLTGSDLLSCGPNAAWRLSQTMSFLPTRGTSNTQRLYQMIGGLEGDLGLGDWTWEAYASHGDTLLEASYIGYPSLEQYRAIVQAPNYGRNYTSPSYLNSKSLSCTTGIPIFEQFAVSQDCIDAIVTDSTDRSSLVQNIYEANFQGGLFELPAGQVRSALGASYRSNSYVFRPDAIRATNYIQDVGVGQFGAVKSGGTTRVRELYGELLVPVLKDLPGAHRLDLELGYRYSMYDSGAGDVPTWKALMNWSPLSWINVRGGYQKVNRAPNIAELYQGETTVVGGGGSDPCLTNAGTTLSYYNNSTNPNRAQTQALCSALIDNAGSDFDAAPNTFTNGGGGLQVQLGNPNLKSESGETLTIGSVFRSPFEHPLARGITASLDYYRAKIEDNIAQLGSQAVLDACFNRQGENPTYSINDAGGYCARIERDPFSGALSRIETPYSNIGVIKTSGIDVSLNWSAALDDMGLSLPGRISAGAQATRVLHFLNQTTVTSAPLDNVGFSNLPRMRSTARMSYSLGAMSAGISWRYQVSVKPFVAQANPNSSTVGGPAYSRFDANAGYGFGPVDLRLSISNLLDKAPPKYGYAPWTSGVGTFLPSADQVGRRFTVTATMRL